MGDVRSLKIYPLAYRLAIDVYDVTRGFPIEERYRLTDQLRRSSRSIVANLVEAYQFRHYTRAFRSKLTIADGELAETRNWLSLAHDHQFLDSEQYKALSDRYAEVGRLLGAMIKHPEKYRP